MILADLEHIFKPQIDEGTDNLYFMLIDGDYKLIQRHMSTDLESLVPLLDNFQYSGTEAKMPRFSK